MKHTTNIWNFSTESTILAQEKSLNTTKSFQSLFLWLPTVKLSKWWFEPDHYRYYHKTINSSVTEDIIEIDMWTSQCHRNQSNFSATADWHFANETILICVLNFLCILILVDTTSIHTKQNWLISRNKLHRTGVISHNMEVY